MYGELRHLSLLTFAQGTNISLVSVPLTSASLWLCLCWIHNSAYSLIHTLETYTLIHGELCKTYGFHWGDECNCLYHTSHNLKKISMTIYFLPQVQYQPWSQSYLHFLLPTSFTNIWPLNIYHSDIYFVTHSGLFGSSWADTPSSICPNPSWWTKCLCS